MVPYEAFLAEKPVVTTTDAGGPLEVVADGRTGAVVAPEAAAVARACAWLRDHRDEARAQGRAGARPPSGSPGTRRSTGCSEPSLEGRLLLAAPAGALGDRRLQRAPASRARAADRRRGRPPRPSPAPARHRRLALPPRQRPGRARLDRRGAARRPGVVVLHEWVLHHLVAGLTLGRRDVATYLAAMERERGLVGRLLGLGVVDGCLPKLWEERPEEFPLAAFVLDETQERGAIVHSRYVEERVRAAGYRGPVWRIPHPAWPAPAVEPADLGAGPLIGSHRPPEPGQAHPRAARGLRAPARTRARGAPAPRRPREPAARPRRAPRRARAGRRRGRRASRTSTSRGSGRSWPAATSASTCATRRWARPPASPCARSPSAARSWSATWAGSRSSPTTRRSRCAGRARGRAAGRHAGAAPRARRRPLGARRRRSPPRRVRARPGARRRPLRRRARAGRRRGRGQARPCWTRSARPRARSGSAPGSHTAAELAERLSASGIVSGGSR